MCYIDTASVPLDAPLLYQEVLWWWLLLKLSLDRGGIAQFFMEGHWERRDMLKCQEGAWGRMWNKLISQNPGPTLGTSGHPFLSMPPALGKIQRVSRAATRALQSWVLQVCPGAWESLLAEAQHCCRMEELCPCPCSCTLRISLPSGSPCCICATASRALGSLGRAAAPSSAHFSSACTGVLHKAALPSVAFHLCPCSQCQQRGRERWY